jgi:hypothetical protein
MAVTHPTLVRNDIANLVVDKIDVGGAGTIVFQDGGVNDSDVATLGFQATAFGAAANGIASASLPITDDTNCNAGNVTKFTVFSGAGDSCFTGSVTATGGGGDIILSSTAIGQGDTITISSLTYEAPN